MIWDELTSPELDMIDRTVPVVLPIAATEQHGPHLPLATDRLIGEYIAGQLHKSIPDRVLILPSATIGFSEHHMDFAGTLTQSHESFIQQIYDTVESVMRHGFTRLLLLNSHGGNQAVGTVLTERLGSQYSEAHVALATWWHLATDELEDITETERGGVGHAGEFETSLMMLIAPHLVRENEIGPGTNIEIFPWAEKDMLRAPKALYYRPMKEMAPNGVFGAPTFASEEKGRKIIDCLIPVLKKIVLDLQSI